LDDKVSDDKPMNQSEIDNQGHWQAVYHDSSASEVSWYQTEPALSLSLIEATGIARDASILDVGGGASVLVDRLLAHGFGQIQVLDISGHALAVAQQRLGEKADQVRWHVGDITQFQPERQVDLWHDRAVLHFLTKSAQRQAYCQALEKSLRPGGHLIIGTFAVDGPTRCSGLDIVQYDVPALLDVLGPKFILQEERRETHLTPANKTQNFAWFRLQRSSD
jgi:2-polyprenyl-3-methyl-5-hydroxy-6-metoxy-1,4-benzoquinol methylase